VALTRQALDLGQEALGVEHVVGWHCCDQTELKHRPAQHRHARACKAAVGEDRHLQLVGLVGDRIRQLHVGCANFKVSALFAFIKASVSSLPFKNRRTMSGLPSMSGFAAKITKAGKSGTMSENTVRTRARPAAPRAAS